MSNPHWPQERIKNFRKHVAKWEVFLPASVFNQILEYLEHHEFGLTVETIRDFIFDQEIIVPTSLFNDLSEWSYEMDIPDNIIEDIILENFTK